MRIERDFKSSNEPEQVKAKAFIKVHSAAARRHRKSGAAGVPLRAGQNVKTQQE